MSRLPRSSLSLRGAVSVVAALAVAGIAVLSGAAAAGGDTEPKAAAAAKPVKKKVSVGDNFFRPARLRVPRRSTIAWKWVRGNDETHDVLLARRPRGVRRFQSAAATTGYRFRRKLRKPGRYLLVCTYHEEMSMTIRVKR